MKKLNYLLLGLAGLAMASCSNDDLQGPADGTYQLTVNLPKDIATRAIGDQITAAQTLYYTLFDADGENVIDNGVQNLNAGVTQTTVNLPLVKGQSYQIAFFSQSQSSTNVYSYENGNVTVEYKNMNYGTDVDADAYDCFYGNLKITEVGGSINESVTLTRPVAQINWGTNDLDAAAVTNVFGTGAANLETTLSMSAFSKLNVLTGDVSEDVTTFATTPLPSTTETFPVSGDYKYLAMQYVLAQTNGTPGTYDITLTVTDKENSETSIVIPVSNAPLQANYRTNIYGGLLTDQANFNIDLSSTWGAPDYSVDGAVVELQEDGTFKCITPVLPAGVTEADMAKADVGAVAISADGTPVYFAPTSEGIKNAMASYSEIYLAPNTEITTQSHIMQVPQRGVTIHGNGATLSGGEQDFALPNNSDKNFDYEAGSTINLTISNLNGVKVWGGPTGNYTINVNLTNCTLKGNGPANGSLSLVMASGADSAESTINFILQNCHAQNTQVAFFSTYPGTTVINNCEFNGVGIPINVAKKFPDKKSNITVSNCDFNDCGITPNSSDNPAWNYSAPIRVVDNGGPEYFTTLLVDNCTFEGTLSQWNILLWDYRAGKTSYPVKYTIENCTPAKPSVYTITEKTTNPESN